MIMSSSKPPSQDVGKARVGPEWGTALQNEGPDATRVRASHTKTKAWWDLLANMIVGRR